MLGKDELMPAIPHASAVDEEAVICVCDHLPIMPSVGRRTGRRV